VNRIYDAGQGQVDHGELKDRRRLRYPHLQSVGSNPSQERHRPQYVLGLEDLVESQHGDHNNGSDLGE
jgi:hypothetical protein